MEKCRLKNKVSLPLSKL